MRVLVFNAGSSSLKLRLVDAANEVIAQRDIERWDGDPDHVDVAGFVAELNGVDAIGHRIVHGGETFTTATVIDDRVVAALAALTPLAPLHQPRALACVAAGRRLLPGVPAVACFDTGFHATLPPAARTYALPREWNERFGLRRYGFHGLSHQRAARRTAQLLGRPVDDLRIVTAHLGAGASLCAVRAGLSVATTMGFTPAEGLVMATRSGDVDPGLLAWLVTDAGIDAAELGAALESKSGLLGLCGHSDLREVLAAADGGDDAARLAYDVWLHRLRAGTAAMAAAMGGVDAIAFTGGIGEHSARARDDACAGLAFVGVHIDASANSGLRGDGVVSARGAAVSVVVVQAREDLQIADETREALR